MKSIEEINLFAVQVEHLLGMNVVFSWTINGFVGEILLVTLVGPSIGVPVYTTSPDRDLSVVLKELVKHVQALIKDKLEIMKCEIQAMEGKYNEVDSFLVELNAIG